MHWACALGLCLTLGGHCLQGVEESVQLWEMVSRASSKRYLLMMAKLWHRSSVPEDRLAMDSYVLHAPEDLPEQATPVGEESLPSQPFK